MGPDSPGQPNSPAEPDSPGKPISPTGPYIFQTLCFFCLIQMLVFDLLLIQ